MRATCTSCLFVGAAFCFCLIPLSCQLQQRKAIDFKGLKEKLERNPSRQTYDALHFLLVDHYTELSTNERKDLRASLEKHSIWPDEILCPATEPGTRLYLQGRLLDEKDQPVAGAQLHIFHTDRKGFYSPLDSIRGSMLEQDPRLEGFLKTDQQGNFSIQTIRPANYPKQYEGRLLPQHVHILVHAKGYEVRSAQIVFYDDPAMNEHWLKWAKEGNQPLVRLEKSAEGLSGKFELYLSKE